MSILCALLFSILFVLVVLRPKPPFADTPWMKYVVLIAFTFPLHLLWPVLWSFHRNTRWKDPLSTAWAIPAVLFAAAALVAFKDTARLYSRDEGTLDESLKIAWRDLAVNPKKLFGQSALIAALIEALLIASASL